MRLSLVIYKLTNKINGKIYIGKSASSLHKRFIEYKSKLKAYQNKTLKSNSHIFAAISKYGIENFSCEIIDYCSSLDELNTMEIFYIGLYHSRDPKIGYNLALGGNGGFAMLGKKHSPQAKARMSAAKKGKPISLAAQNARVGLGVGEKNNAAKLTWEIVRSIRKERETNALSMRKLAEKYKISSSMIFNILSGKYWKE